MSYSALNQALHSGWLMDPTAHFSYKNIKIWMQKYTGACAVEIAQWVLFSVW